MVKRGAALQPFIYAAMLKAEGLSSESVGYYSLKDVRISRVPKNKDLKEGRTLDYFIESSLLYLDSIVGSMRSGDYEARPLSDATCRHCHERPYCPYIQRDAK
ncbi:MAG: PD-(D/E)XK nuclease family protein [Nitrospirota bacterium]